MNMLSIVEQQEGQGEAGGGVVEEGLVEARMGGAGQTDTRRIDMQKRVNSEKGRGGREGEREGVMEGDKDSTRASKYIIY